MNKSYLLGEDFDNLVRQVFLAEGYKIIVPSPPNDSGFDFMLKSPDGFDIVVEAKLFRTRVVPRGIIMNALWGLEAARVKLQADNAYLVISGTLSIPISDFGKVDIFDLGKVAELVAKHPNLAEDFETISRQLTPMAVPNDAEYLSARLMGDAYIGNAPSLEPGPALKKGPVLVEALRKTRPGRDDASKFEMRALEAIKYIFENDFSNWLTQEETDTKISRFDAIARIASTHDFWKSIVASFRSWYVVFEFKNYSDEISQGQIYTTEKYLFAGAMRSVALIISSKGADKNALAAARGAARETGKLIVNLSVDDICEMIEMRDRGDDPNSFMFDRLDDMLMRLER